MSHATIEALAQAITAELQSGAAAGQPVTFATLQEQIEGFAAPTLPALLMAPSLALARNPQVVVWVGHSEDANEALLPLLTSGRVRVTPCARSLYPGAAYRPPLPLLRPDQVDAPLAAQHWLPVTLALAPAAGN